MRSVWDIPNEHIPGPSHFSRFPTELPRRCIEALGLPGSELLVLDPFTGSGSTGVAALGLGCRFLGFELDPQQAEAANRRRAELPRPPAA